MTGRENGLKLWQGKSQLDFRENSFMESVVRHWNRPFQCGGYHSWRDLKCVWMCHLGLMVALAVLVSLVGLHDLRCLLQLH